MIDTAVVIGSTHLWGLCAVAFLATICTGSFGAYFAGRDARSEGRLRAGLLLAITSCLIFDLGVVIAAWLLGEPGVARSLILAALLPLALVWLGIPLVLVQVLHDDR